MNTILQIKLYIYNNASKACYGGTFGIYDSIEGEEGTLNGL